MEDDAKDQDKQGSVGKPVDPTPQRGWRTRLLMMTVVTIYFLWNIYHTPGLV